MSLINGLFFVISVVIYFTAGIHRLDRLTSGIIILTKTEAKTKEMMELVKKRQLQKEYVCRVDGQFPR